MLHYRRGGNETGETIVMIHGFLCDQTIFKDVEAALQEHYDVVLIDLPGHGASEAFSGESIDAYVQAIGDVLAHEKIANATWLGHSMGGYITLAAMQTDLQIDKAILAYSGVTADDAEKKEKREQQIADIEQDGVAPFVEASLPAFFGDDPGELVELMRIIANKASVQGLKSALRAMKTRDDQQSFINETDVPTLIIEGAQDKMMPPIEVDNIAVQKTMTATGHLGMLEDPQAFVKAIRQFIG